MSPSPMHLHHTREVSAAPARDVGHEESVSRPGRAVDGRVAPGAHEKPGQDARVLDGHPEIDAVSLHWNYALAASRAHAHVPGCPQTRYGEPRKDYGQRQNTPQDGVCKVEPSDARCARDEEDGDRCRCQSDTSPGDHRHRGGGIPLLRGRDPWRRARPWHRRPTPAPSPGPERQGRLPPAWRRRPPRC